MPSNSEAYESIIKEQHTHSLTIDTKSMRRYIIGDFGSEDGSLRGAISQLWKTYNEIDAAYNELVDDPNFWIEDGNKLAWMKYFTERQEIVKRHISLLSDVVAAINEAMSTYETMHDTGYAQAESYDQTAWYLSV